MALRRYRCLLLRAGKAHFSDKAVFRRVSEFTYELDLDEGMGHTIRAALLNGVLQDGGQESDIGRYRLTILDGKSRVLLHEYVAGPAPTSGPWPAGPLASHTGEQPVSELLQRLKTRGPPAHLTAARDGLARDEVGVLVADRQVAPASVVALPERQVRPASVGEHDLREPGVVLVDLLDRFPAPEHPEFQLQVALHLVKVPAADRAIAMTHDHCSFADVPWRPWRHVLFGLHPGRDRRPAPPSRHGSLRRLADGAGGPVQRRRHPGRRPRRQANRAIQFPNGPVMAMGALPAGQRLPTRHRARGHQHVPRRPHRPGHRALTARLACGLLQ